MSADLGAVAQLEEEVTQLRRELAAALRAERRAKARTDDLVDAFFRAAATAAIAIGKPAPVAPAPRDRRRRREEVALIHATDWQVGKRTRTYSPEVATRRIAQLGEVVCEIAAIQRTDHPVRRAMLMLGGDMVEGGGSIFPGQAHEIDSSLFEQTFQVALMIESLVRRLLAEFETVEVAEEYGNHGRLGRPGDLPDSDNIDRIAYRIAAERFKGDRRVIWHPSNNWHAIVVVGNYRALLFHGDEVKGFGGQTPAFGIARKVTAWSSGVVAPFTDAYCGHYHQIMTLTIPNGGRVFMTGSPESDNEYAREFVAGTGRPSQRLHFIDPDKGRVTSEHVLWLD